MQLLVQESSQRQSGFSLIELMIAVAIIGIVAAVATPLYTDYIETSKKAVLTQNIQALRLMEEEARLSQGAYQAGTFDPANPNAAGGLKETIAWNPGPDNDGITYVVDQVTATSFRVTASYADGVQVQRTFSR